MQRVDMLLAELLRKFPPPIPPMMHQQQNSQDSLLNTQDGNSGNSGNQTDASPTGANLQGMDIKQENVDMKPPPEKKVKT